jgi:hypothetical protein
MSIEIRRAISLNTRRLANLLTSYDAIRVGLEETPHDLDDHRLYAIFETATEIFDKGAQYVQKLEQLDKQWNELIAQNPNEVEVKLEYINKFGEYLPVLENGRQAVDHIRRRILRLRDAVKTKLDLSDINEDAHSQGTLNNIPPNDEIFTTPTRSPIPSGLTTPIELPESQPKQVIPETQLNGATGQIHPMPEPANSNWQRGNVQPSNTPLNWADMLFLPHVTIPSFNGNPSRWSEFWDLFSAMVDQRAIEPCVKLFHLRSHLEGEPKQSLAHLGNSNSDYEVALKTLHDLYGDPLRVTHRIRAELIHFRVNDKSAVNLYKGWSRLHQLYSQLQNFGDATDNTFLAQVIESKFPRYVLQKVYKRNKSALKGQEMLEEIGNVLRKEATLDRIMSDNKAEFFNSDSKAKHAHKNTHPFREHPLTNEPILTHMAKDENSKRSIKCNFCDQEHSTYKCQIYREPRDRAKQVRIKRLCLNCLSDDHFVANCPSKHSCHHCEQRHHSSVCLKNNPIESSTREQNKSKRVKFDDRKSEQNERDSTDSDDQEHANAITIINEDEIEQYEEEDHVYLSQNSTPRQSTMLMTTTSGAFNPANHKQGRTVTVFIDTGSTKTYITERLAQQLRLKQVGKEKLQINTFGNRTLLKGTANIYQLELKRLGDPNANPILIKATALPELTSTLYAPKFEGIVSNEIPVKRVVPQILIGMDQAFKIDIQNTTTKLPSGFSLNQSAIGPVIYGNGHIFCGPSIESTICYAYWSKSSKMPKSGGIKLHSKSSIREKQKHVKVLEAEKVKLHSTNSRKNSRLLPQNLDIKKNDSTEKSSPQMRNKKFGLDNGKVQTCTTAITRLTVIISFLTFLSVISAVQCIQSTDGNHMKQLHSNSTNRIEEDTLCDLTRTVIKTLKFVFVNPIVICLAIIGTVILLTWIIGYSYENGLILPTVCPHIHSAQGRLQRRKARNY